MFISEIIGKNLTNNGEDLGQITAVAVTKPSEKCSVIVGDNAFYAEKMYCRENVEASGISETKLYSPLKSNLPCYELTGKYLGEFFDAELTPYCKLKNIILKNGSSYAKNRIFSVGDAILIKSEQIKDAKIKEKKTPKPKREVDKTAENTADIKERNSAISSHAANRKGKRYGDFGFLIGRTVDKNITNFQGEIMVKAGDVITLSLLHQAKVSGKLIELCLHTK